MAFWLKLGKLILSLCMKFKLMDLVCCLHVMKFILQQNIDVDCSDAFLCQHFLLLTTAGSQSEKKINKGETGVPHS